MSNTVPSKIQTKPHQESLKRTPSLQTRNLIAQNQVHKLHVTSLSQILKSVDRSISTGKISQNKLEINFPDTNEELTKVQKSLQYQRWKGIKANFRGFFSQIKVSPKMLKAWTKEDLYSLKKMSLIFNRCDKITENELENILFEITRYLPNLREFTLTFSCNPDIKDASLGRIGRLIIRNLPHLRYLSLGFSCCKNISGNGLHLLTSPISRNLTRLEQLFLNFGGCGKTTDEELLRFGNKISTHLTRLKKFAIYLWASDDITNEGLVNFVTVLCQSLVNLEKLSLNFRRCRGLSPNGFDRVADVINHSLQNLKKIVLVFEGVEGSGIGHDCLRSLSDKILEHKGHSVKVLTHDDPAEKVHYQSYREVSA